MLSYACFRDLAVDQSTMHSNVCPTLLPTTKFHAKQQLHSIEVSSHHGRRMLSHALPVRISLGRRFRSRRFFPFFLFAADAAATPIRPMRQRRRSGRRPPRRLSFAADAHFSVADSLERRALRCARALRLPSLMRRVAWHVCTTTPVALRA
jgi:hypothetical protein